MDRRGMKRAAREALDGASCDHKKIITVYTLVPVAMALLLTAVNFLLDQAVEGTGGLSGLGVRSVLQTAQSLLSAGHMIFQLFWQMGFVYVVLGLSRRGSMTSRDLLEGFRQFGPVFRLQMLMAAVYLAVTIVASYVASAIFVFTPWAEPLADAMYNAATEEALMAAMEQCMIPLTVTVCAVLVILGAPVYYRLRMAQYLLMDQPKDGAVAAYRRSRAMMKGNRVELLKLDLSFWWFYLLEVAAYGLMWLDVILGALGVTLPWPDAVNYFLFTALYGAAYVLLYRWKGNQVNVTYAKVYASLLPPEEPVHRPVIEQ